MSKQRFQLRATDGRIIISSQDLATLGLAVGASINEQELRRRITRLTHQSLAQAIHAMLDQEEPRVTIIVQPYP